MLGFLRASMAKFSRVLPTKKRKSTECDIFPTPPKTPCDGLTISKPSVTGYMSSPGTPVRPDDFSDHFNDNTEPSIFGELKLIESNACSLPETSETLEQSNPSTNLETSVEEDSKSEPLPTSSEGCQIVESKDKCSLPEESVEEAIPPTLGATNDPVDQLVEPPCASVVDGVSLETTPSCSNEVRPPSPEEIKTICLESSAKRVIYSLKLSDDNFEKLLEENLDRLQKLYSEELKVSLT